MCQQQCCAGPDQQLCHTASHSRLLCRPRSGASLNSSSQPFGVQAQIKGSFPTLACNSGQQFALQAQVKSSVIQFLTAICCAGPGQTPFHTAPHSPLLCRPRSRALSYSSSQPFGCSSLTARQVQKQRQAQAEQEMAPCTFHPSLDPHSLALVAKLVRHVAYGWPALLGTGPKCVGRHSATQGQLQCHWPNQCKSWIPVV